MRRTVVFCRENAQLGNRLIVYAHLLAAARERGWELHNPTFEPYADWFIGTCSRPHGRRMWPVRLAWQLGKICAPLSSGLIARARARGLVEVDLQATLSAAESRATRWLLVQGYRIRCPDWACKQAEGVRRFFTPVDAFRMPAERRLAEIRARVDVVVGIHVRHGDYAQHLGGRFFYSFVQYARFMRAMAAHLAPQRVGFVICSHVPWITTPSPIGIGARPRPRRSRPARALLVRLHRRTSQFLQRLGGVSRSYPRVAT